MIPKKIPCIRKNGNQLQLLEPCPFCGKKHTHGLGDGSRVPHCENPPRTEEYFVYEVPSETEEEEL